MKLVLAIVEDDMSFDIIKALASQKYRTTKLSSTGGFLKKGNTTLLLGVEDDEVEKVVSMIKNISDNRLKADEKMDVANANIFILDMKDYIRM